MLWHVSLSKLDHFMNTVLASACLKLETVRELLVHPTTWRLPEDLNAVAQEKALKFDDLSKFPDLSSKFIPLHSVAILSAAAAFLFKKPNGPAVALSLVNLYNSLPKPGFKKPEGADLTNTVFDITGSVENLTDQKFSELLHSLFDSFELAEDEKILLDNNYITAASVLLVASLAECVVDYSEIILAITAEINGAAGIPSDEFTREIAPLYLSKTAQRLTDIVTNSKLIKKKGGSGDLTKLPEVFAPILSTIAAIRTNISKPLHFYGKFNLTTLQTQLINGITYILQLLDSQAQPVTINDCISQLVKVSYNKFVATKAIIDEKQAKMPKGRSLPFGLITKDFLTKVEAEGLAPLAELIEFKLATGKNVTPKEASGTRDLMPLQMRVREQVIGIVTSIFKRHGAVNIDTPVFELREVLTEKYGEEAKLIYNLEDQGGELLSLRYDLTVPFARFVATHGITNIKRYHVAKVYRRDRPAIERGRFREFYQCDFDIAGNSSPMIADSEVIAIIAELLTAIGGITDFDYVIHVSHRQLLSAMTEVAGVPPEKFKTVCSSVDKLDKQEWSEVRNELVSVKGLSPQSADKLWEFLQINGEPFSVVSRLREKADLLAVAGKTIDEMELLFTYLKSLNVIEKIDFNLSLARGLDYYTGVIFEAGAKDGKVGSIAGGGRYDELIGMFSRKKVPAVGVSLGIERVFTLIEQKIAANLKPSETQVFICSVFENYTLDRLEIASQLWKENIATEFVYKEKADIKVQLGQADSSGAKLAIIIAPEEKAEDKVKIKILSTKEEITIQKTEIVSKVKELLAQ